MKIFYFIVIIATAAALEPRGWAQSNLPMAIPLPTTNLLPVTVSVTRNVPAPTNIVSRLPAVDTSRLARQLADTDAETKQKVALAIQAIRAENGRIAIKQLEAIRATKTLSPDQEKAVDATLEQIRAVP